MFHSWQRSAGLCRSAGHGHAGRRPPEVFFLWCMLLCVGHGTDATNLWGLTSSHRSADSSTAGRRLLSQAPSPSGLAAPPAAARPQPCGGNGGGCPSPPPPMPYLKARALAVGPMAPADRDTCLARTPAGGQSTVGDNGAVSLPVPLGSPSSVEIISIGAPITTAAAGVAPPAATTTTTTGHAAADAASALPAGGCLDPITWAPYAEGSLWVRTTPDLALSASALPPLILSPLAAVASAAVPNPRVFSEVADTASRFARILGVPEDLTKDILFFDYYEATFVTTTSHGSLVTLMQASLLATLHVAAGFLAGAAAKTGVTLTRRQAMAAAQLGAADLLLGDIPWNLTLDQDLLEHLKASFARVPAVLSGIGTAHAFVNVTSNGAGGGGGGAAAAVLLADVTVPVTVSGGGSGGGGRSQLTSLTTLLTTDPIMQVSSLALAASTATANALIARRQGTLAQAATSSPPSSPTPVMIGPSGGGQQQPQAAGAGDVPLAVLQGWVLEAVNVAAAAAGAQAEAAQSLGAGNVGISEFSTRFSRDYYDSVASPRFAVPGMPDTWHPPPAPKRALLPQPPGSGQTLSLALIGGIVLASVAGLVVLMSIGVGAALLVVGVRRARRRRQRGGGSGSSAAVVPEEGGGGQEDAEESGEGEVAGAGVEGREEGESPEGLAGGDVEGDQGEGQGHGEEEGQDGERGRREGGSGRPAETDGNG